MSDEDLYLQATQEAKGENRQEALWSKAMALCEGDEPKAKYKYINLRVQQLKIDDQKPKENAEGDANEIEAKEKILRKALLRANEEAKDTFIAIEDPQSHLGKNEISDYAERNINTPPGTPASTPVPCSTIAIADNGHGHKTQPKLPPGFIPVKDFSNEHDFDESIVIARIQHGTYNGLEKDGKWYIKKEKPLDDASTVESRTSEHNEPKTYGQSELTSYHSKQNSEHPATTINYRPSNFSLSWFLFSFEGRIGRQAFWCAYPVMFVASFILSVAIEVAKEYRSINGLIIVSILGFFLMWPCLAIQVKRWHDRNKSGNWAFLNMIPLIGLLWITFELGFLKGTVGKNDYGNDPLATTN